MLSDGIETMTFGVRERLKQEETCIWLIVYLSLTSCDHRTKNAGCSMLVNRVRSDWGKKACYRLPRNTAAKGRVE